MSAEAGPAWIDPGVERDLHPPGPDRPARARRAAPRHLHRRAHTGGRIQGRTAGSVPARLFSGIPCVRVLRRGGGSCWRSRCTRGRAGPSPVWASKFSAKPDFSHRARKRRADLVGEVGVPGAAQAVLDEHRGGRPDRAAPVAVGRGSAAESGGSVARPYAVRWASIRSASASRDVGGQVLAEHDRHEVEQAASWSRCAAGARRRARRTARRPTARRSRAVCDPRRPSRGQRGRVVGAAQFGGEAGQFAQLQDEERGQVGGLDDAVGVEGGGVVPAAVVAVLVVGQGGWPGARRCGEPEVRPAAQPVVGLGQLLPVERLGQAPAQVAEGPAVDGRLDEVVAGPRSGSPSRAARRVGVLVVEGQLELVPGEVRGSRRARARALKQWSQLQTLSIQCLDISTAGRVTKPAGRDGGGPQHVGGEFGGRGVGGRATARPRRRTPRTAAPAAARPRRRSPAGGTGRGRVSILLDRDLPGLAVGGQVRGRARRCPAPARRRVARGAGQHGDPVAAAGLVRGEHVRAVDRVAVEVGAAERGQGRRGRRDAQAQARRRAAGRCPAPRRRGRSGRPPVRQLQPARRRRRPSVSARVAVGATGTRRRTGCMPVWCETRCRSSA